jgi:type I restriction enzyme, S subunit
MKKIPFNIPSNWTWSTMGEIADVVGGGTPRTNDPENYEGGTISWITPADLSGYTAKNISHGERFITTKGLSGSSAKMMPSGTVLFSSRAPVGYVAIATNPVCTNQGFKSFVLKNKDNLPDYLYWWLKGSKDLAESLASGTTFLELSGAKAKQLPIPLAPPGQQQSIVAEIEKQFSRLDEAVANLKRVKANLKRYKASVLKSAVEGKLTADWRKQHPNVEPASKLLERILAERRAKWKGKGVYKAPALPDTTNLSELPNGWEWATVGQLCLLDSGEAFKKRDYSSEGLRLLQIANVGFGQVEWEQKNFLPLKFETMFPELIMQAGDLVLALNRPIIGESLKVACVSKKDLPAILYQRVGRLRPAAWTNPLFLFCFLRSPVMLAAVRKRLQGTDQPYLNTSLVPEISVPLPPVSEQHCIVAEVERRLSVIEELEAAVQANLTRADRLRQSILSTAFSGRLEVSELEIARRANKLIAH